MWARNMFISNLKVIFHLPKTEEDTILVTRHPLFSRDEFDVMQTVKLPLSTCKYVFEFLIISPFLERILMEHIKSVCREEFAFLSLFKF